MNTTCWELPAGIEEVLPEQAWAVEALRRRLLDHYRASGYGLVIPPIVEFVDSLLTGTGEDLDLLTFKLTDRLTGRLMGVRADMTPQMARIDAHSLREEGVSRLCYLGSVLRTMPDGFAGSRSPMQVGAELFGHAGVEADIEIVGLMIETLAIAGITAPVIDLGHVGVFAALAKQAGLNETAERELQDMFQRKALPEIDQYLRDQGVPEPSRRMLSALGRLHGDAAVIAQAREVLVAGGADVAAALDRLERLVAVIARRYPKVRLQVDLTELHGYAYHTGVVFAAYVEGVGHEIARGGRYDEVGKVFGRARPATGFSADIRELMRWADGNVEPAEDTSSPIYAPCDLDDPSLDEAIAALRAQGHVVVRMLPCEEPVRGRRLQRNNDSWLVLEI